MKQSINITAYLKPIRHFFERFHLTIFIVALVGGLAYAIVSLYGLLSDASTIPTNPTTTSQASFDQSTISRLDQMYSSDKAPASIQLPSGRINPLDE